MKFVSKITDLLLYRQFEHVHKEFNRTRIAPIYGGSAVAGVTVGTGATTTTLETVSFNVPFSGALVTVSSSGNLVLGSTVPACEVGAEFLWDSEAATNRNSSYIYNPSTASKTVGFAYSETRELAAGKHTVAITGYRGSLTGTITAHYNYTITMYVKGGEAVNS